MRFWYFSNMRKNLHSDIFSRAGGLNFGLSLHLHPYIAYAGSEGSDKSVHLLFFFFWFGLILYVPVNSYGHVGTVSSPNHTFFLLDKLD